MAAELIIAPEAQQDVKEAYGWYEDRRPGFGDEFLKSGGAVWLKLPIFAECDFHHHT